MTKKLIQNFNYGFAKNMKLKNFIKKLKNLAQKHGDDIEVIMADEIPVVDPIFSDGYSAGKNVVITDELEN